MGTHLYSLKSNLQTNKKRKMASQNQNLHKLLQAEKRAQDIIAKARQRKAEKLRQAKDEAKQEVINYKKEREIAFKNLEMQIYGDKQNNEQHMAQKTENDIYNMQCMVQQNYHRVFELVTGLVFDVRPALHVNYDGRE